ncbi:hypothetical protein BaRGS_00007965, partial [Batillaria attramentaria]
KCYRNQPHNKPLLASSAERSGGPLDSLHDVWGSVCQKLVVGLIPVTLLTNTLRKPQTYTSEMSRGHDKKTDKEGSERTSQSTSVRQDPVLENNTVSVELGTVTPIAIQPVNEDAPVYYNPIVTESMRLLQPDSEPTSSSTASSIIRYFLPFTENLFSWTTSEDNVKSNAQDSSPTTCNIRRGTSLPSVVSREHISPLTTEGQQNDETDSIASRLNRLGSSYSEHFLRYFTDGSAGTEEPDLSPDISEQTQVPIIVFSSYSEDDVTSVDDISFNITPKQQDILENKRVLKVPRRTSKRKKKGKRRRRKKKKRRDTDYSLSSSSSPRQTEKV